MREYSSHGKSVKYFQLKKEFDKKYLKASKAYLERNVEELKNSNPGKAYRVFKRMSARPGESEKNNVKLPVHGDLSPSEIANRIAQHFSKISQEYPPLSASSLPERVLVKLKNPQSESSVPFPEEFQVHAKIKKANKPNS